MRVSSWASRCITLALLALAAALLLPIMPAEASSEHRLDVGATVVSRNVCRFRERGPTAVDFGAIDPSGTADRTVSVNIPFRCQGRDQMATYSVTSDGGLAPGANNQPRMQHATQPGEFLPYQVNLPQSATIPRNTEQMLSISATVTPVGYANALVGSYADTITLTINP